LHRRGWRQELAHAPLRETLAAALVLLCNWDPTTPFYDAMCGAGTLPLEACALAMQMAPGLKRTFAFQDWPSFDAALWARLSAEAEAARLRAPPAPIIGTDRSAAAVNAARHNAERAGLLAHVALAQSELDAVRPPPGPGLVLMNPPYGRRVGDARTLRRLYGDIGRTLRAHFSGWRAALLISDLRLLEPVGATVVADHTLVNGGIRVHLVELEMSKMKR
jgi:putative N6-adenine-specific DNA methylase